VSRPRPVDAEALRDLPLPPLSTGGDKETRGRVLAIAGGARVPGAALLTGVAALRAGAGKLQLAATRAAALAVTRTKCSKPYSPLVFEMIRPAS